MPNRSVPNHWHCHVPSIARGSWAKKYDPARRYLYLALRYWPCNPSFDGYYIKVVGLLELFSQILSVWGWILTRGVMPETRTKMPNSFSMFGRYLPSLSIAIYKHSFVLNCRFLLTLNAPFIFKTDFFHNSQWIGWLLLMVSLTDHLADKPLGMSVWLSLLPIDVWRTILIVGKTIFWTGNSGLCAWRKGTEQQLNSALFFSPDVALMEPPASDSCHCVFPAMMECTLNCGLK